MQLKTIFNFAFVLVSFTILSQGKKVDSLKNELLKANSDTTRINLYLKLHDQVRLSDFNEAARIAKESYLLATKIDWQKGIAKTARNYGIALNLLGKYDSSEMVLKRSVASSKEISDLSNLAYSYMALGNLQYDQTNYNDALKYYFQSLDTYDSVSNYAGMSSALIWVGIIYQFAQAEHKKAINTYMEALEYASLGNSTLNKGYIYSNLATIYYNEYEYDSAILYYKRSNEIKQQFSDQRGIGNDYNNIGNVWYELKKYDSALFYYERSLKIRKEMNDKTGIASAYINMGKVFSDLELDDQAIANLFEGYKVAKEVGYKEAWQQASLLLSMQYEKEKQFQDALSFHKEYKSVSDSIFNLESDRSLNELQTQYETEKKEQQIALQEAEISEQEAELKRRQTLLIGSIILIIAIIALALTQRSRLKKKQELKLKEAKLEAREAEIKATISSQEKERARYARDLHDGFGQMISILNMNLKSLEDGAKPDERQKVYNASVKVIDDMYGELKNICFDLMPQTLVKHGLNSALSEFTERVNQSGKLHLELNTFGLEKRLTEIQEISLYRISQEWINNTLKYSDAEKVTLQITKDEGEITLLIEDNGSGFDKTKLTSSKGNGWKNLNTRTNLIKGELELETEYGKKGNVLIVNAPAVVETTSAEAVNT